MDKQLSKKKRLYSYLESNPISSQRTVAKDLELSVGSVNSMIKEGLDQKEITVKDLSYREKKYKLTAKGKKVCLNSKVQCGVILAAGEEKHFQHPRCLLSLGEENLLDRHIKILREMGINRIVLVIGENHKLYNKYSLEKNVEIIQNSSYKSTGTLYSLSLIKESVKEDFILIEGDLIYDKEVIKELISDGCKNSTVISSLSNNRDSVFISMKGDKLVKISKDPYSLDNINGELVGISKISYPFFLKMMSEMRGVDNPLIYYEYILERVAKTLSMNCLTPTSLLWSEIDNEEQFKNARDIYKIIKLKEDN